MATLSARPHALESPGGGTVSAASTLPRLRDSARRSQELLLKTAAGLRGHDEAQPSVPNEAEAFVKMISASGLPRTMESSGATAGRDPEVWCTCEVVRGSSSMAVPAPLQTKAVRSQTPVWNYEGRLAQLAQDDSLKFVLMIQQMGPVGEVTLSSQDLKGGRFADELTMREVAGSPPITVLVEVFVPAWAAGLSEDSSLRLALAQTQNSLAKARADVAKLNQELHITRQDLMNETNAFLKDKRRLEQELDDSRKVSSVLEEQVAVLREQVSLGKRHSQVQLEAQKKQAEDAEKQAVQARKSETEVRDELEDLRQKLAEGQAREENLRKELDGANEALQKQLHENETLQGEWQQKHNVMEAELKAEIAKAKMKQAEAEAALQEATAKNDSERQELLERLEQAAKREELSSSQTQSSRKEAEDAGAEVEQLKKQLAEAQSEGHTSAQRLRAERDEAAEQLRQLQRSLSEKDVHERLLREELEALKLQLDDSHKAATHRETAKDGAAHAPGADTDGDELDLVECIIDGKQYWLDPDSRAVFAWEEPSPVIGRLLTGGLLQPLGEEDLPVPHITASQGSLAAGTTKDAEEMAFLFTVLEQRDQKILALEQELQNARRELKALPAGSMLAKSSSSHGSGGSSPKELQDARREHKAFTARSLSRGSSGSSSKDHQLTLKLVAPEGRSPGSPRSPRTPMLEQIHEEAEYRADPGVRRSLKRTSTSTSTLAVGLNVEVVITVKQLTWSKGVAGACICRCEVPGKPESQIETPVAQVGEQVATWDYTGSFVSYSMGDTIRFRIFDVQRQLLGEVSLESSQMYLTEAGQIGFIGSLLMMSEVYSELLQLDLTVELHNRARPKTADSIGGDSDSDFEVHQVSIDGQKYWMDHVTRNLYSIEDSTPLVGKLGSDGHVHPIEEAASPLTQGEASPPSPAAKGSHSWGVWPLSLGEPGETQSPPNSPSENRRLEQLVTGTPSHSPKQAALSRDDVKLQLDDPHGKVKALEEELEQARRKLATVVQDLDRAASSQSPQPHKSPAELQQEKLRALKQELEASPKGLEAKAAANKEQQRLAALLSAEQEAAEGVRQDLEALSSEKEALTQQLEDALRDARANAASVSDLRAALRRAEHGRQEAEEAQCKAMEALQRQTKEYAAFNARKQTAKDKALGTSLKQAEELQKCIEQISANKEEIQTLTAERDRLRAELDADPRRHRDRSASPDSRSQHQGQPEMELQAPAEEQSSGASAVAAVPAAVSGVVPAMIQETLALRERQVEQLQARVASYADREHHLAQQLAQQKYKNTLLGERLVATGVSFAELPAPLEDDELLLTEVHPDQQQLSAAQQSCAAKDRELEQLRKSLSLSAEREQELMELFNVQKMEVEELRAQNKEMQEVVERRRATGWSKQDASVNAPGEHVAEVLRLEEALGVRTRDLEQLKLRLITQAERENDLSVQLAVKEEEARRLQEVFVEVTGEVIQADGTVKPASRSRSPKQDKLLEVSDAEVLQKLEKRLAAKEQELESVRNRALQDRAAQGLRLHSAEEKASSLQNALEKLTLEYEAALAKEAALSQKEHEKAEKEALALAQLEGEKRFALAAEHSEVELLRERLARECAVHAERHQRELDDLTRLTQKLAEAEAERDRLRKVVQLEKYSDAIQQLRQEEEAAGQLRYEGYDEMRVPSGRFASPTRKDREERDTILRAISHEKEELKRQKERTDQICEVQANQLAELRRATGADLLVQTEELLAQRTHELGQTRAQLEALKKQLERRDMLRATDAETSQRMGEELGEKQQGLLDLKSQLEEALTERELWKARHDTLEAAQKDIDDEREAVRRVREEERAALQLRMEELRDVVRKEFADEEEALAKKQQDIQEMIARFTAQQPEDLIKASTKPIVKCLPLQPTVWVYDEAEPRAGGRRILRIEVPGRRCDAPEKTTVSSTVTALSNGVLIRVAKDPDAPLGVRFLHPEVVTDEAGLWEWKYEPDDGMWFLQEPWSFAHGVLTVELRKQTQEPAKRNPLLEASRATFEPDDELMDAAASGMLSPDHQASAMDAPFLSVPPMQPTDAAPWLDPTEVASGMRPAQYRPPRSAADDSSPRQSSALRHAIISAAAPTDPSGTSLRPWRRFTPDSMLRTAGGRTIPASELAVGMLLVGPNGTVQVLAVRWRSPEKQDVVTIPTGRGVFSVVSAHWLLARPLAIPDSSAIASLSLDSETAHQAWAPVEAAQLRAGAHEVMIHGPQDKHEAAVLTSTRWRSQRTWTVDAEFSSSQTIFLYVHPAALRSGARSSRSQQQRGGRSFTASPRPR